MKQTTRHWLGAAMMATAVMLATTGCHNHDAIDYKPYTVTNADRVSHAEKTLGVTLDKQHDWALTGEYSVKITADADLDNISSVAVLDANPFMGESFCLSATPLTNGGSTTLAFRAPTAATILYAACLTADGQCVARPFAPGVDGEVSFVYQGRPAESRRAATVMDPIEETFYMKYVYTFSELLHKVLPEGKDNRSVLGGHNFTNAVKIRKNPYPINALPLAYIGGNSSDMTDLNYHWFPQGAELGMESFLIDDKYPAGWNNFTLSSPNTYELKGYSLYCRNQDGQAIRVFTPGDVVKFQVAKNGKVLDDGDEERVKVFQVDQYVVVACEDGDNWDYNDRVYWIPEGIDRIREITDPVPPVPQVWTYAWEDQDFGDYDMNDCVIQVKDNAADDTKVDITLVALGATRDLWLGFENKAAKSYLDYTPVFEKELHDVLGVPRGTMVNTGLTTAKPVSITLSKPAGFNYQTCSFVLGCRQEGSMVGVYENDYYSISIASAGQDPHGIVIPGIWQWPTERTCIKEAYPTFNEWAHDRTKALDWYKHPAEGKVVVNQ